MNESYAQQQRRDGDDDADEESDDEAVANDFVWYTLVDGYSGERARTPGAVAVRVMPVRLNSLYVS